MKEYSTTEEHLPDKLSEPIATEYSSANTVIGMHYRMVSDDVIENDTLSLDESERLLTDKIHKHFHPEL